MKKSLFIFLLFVLIQWIVLLLFPVYVSFLTAILLGVFWATEKKVFWKGMLIGIFAWAIPLIRYFTPEGTRAAATTAQVFQLSSGNSWIIFLIPLLLGGFITAVSMQIGKYLRFSFQQL